ncbi:MAG: SDR family oxidoreductase, partial [Bacteroidales bacterium]|nr:SDR family oxidoreductase [Bacteroidales bacterium]
MMKRKALDGLTALITGASRGIGRAIALSLAAEGAALMLSSRDDEALNELVHFILDRGGNAVHCASDITTEEGLQELTEFTQLIYPSLDILVHNAGAGAFGPHQELDIRDWEFQMAVNATAIFRLTRAMEPMLSNSHAPQLIGILSDAATRFFHAGSAYSASKAAAHAYLASLRIEWRKQGRRVSAIYPGLVATAFDGKSANERYKMDWLDPEDVAEAVVYICRQAPHVLIDEIVLHP